MNEIIKKNSTGSYKVKRYENGEIALLSYDTVIIITNGETISLDGYFHDFSRTTSKHIGIFLRDYTNFKTPNDLRKACEDPENENASYQIYQDNNSLYPYNYTKNNKYLKYHEF